MGKIVWHKPLVLEQSRQWTNIHETESDEAVQTVKKTLKVNPDFTVEVAPEADNIPTPLDEEPDKISLSLMLQRRPMTTK